VFRERRKKQKLPEKIPGALTNKTRTPPLEHVFYVKSIALI
jgi:hypothetical protein